MPRRPIASRWSRCLILITLSLWGVLGTGLPAAAADASLLKAMEEEIAALMERNRPFVVSIQGIARRRDGAEPGTSGPTRAVRRTVGSGIILDGIGHVLTTGEVIGDAEFIQVSLASGQVVDAELLAIDEDSKVAVLTLDGKVTSSPRFGDSDRVRMGHYALIIGNAYGTMAPSLGSVVDLHGDSDLIQISGSAWPGNSGAPVFNSGGQVVGIIRGILAPSGQDGPSEPGRDREAWTSPPATLLAIPINQARRIAGELMSGGWLGVGVEFARQDGVPRVFQIVKEGPAYAAGLRVGDNLLSYNGQKIPSGNHLERLVKGSAPGDVAEIEVERDRQRLMLRVKIGLRGSPAPRRPPPGLAVEPAVPGPDGRDVMQRLLALERQMQMLLQRPDRKAEK